MGTMEVKASGEQKEPKRPERTFLSMLVGQKVLWKIA